MGCGARRSGFASHLLPLLACDLRQINQSHRTSGAPSVKWGYGSKSVYLIRCFWASKMLNYLECSECSVSVDYCYFWALSASLPKHTKSCVSCASSGPQLDWSWACAMSWAWGWKGETSTLVQAGDKGSVAARVDERGQICRYIGGIMVVPCAAEGEEDPGLAPTWLTDSQNVWWWCHK